MIEDGKLWFVGGGTRTRAVARRECVTKDEAMVLARTEHEKGGHFHRDLIKIVLLGGLYCAPTFHMDSIWNPSNLADSIWIPSIPYGMVLGEVPAILWFPFHMDSTWIPCGIHVE
jgi:hypothetical protein